MHQLILGILAASDTHFTGLDPYDLPEGVEPELYQIQTNYGFAMCDRLDPEYLAECFQQVADEHQQAITYTIPDVGEFTAYPSGQEPECDACEPEPPTFAEELTLIADQASVDKITTGLLDAAAKGDYCYWAGSVSQAVIDHFVAEGLRYESTSIGAKFHFGGL